MKSQPKTVRQNNRGKSNSGKPAARAARTDRSKPRLAFAGKVPPHFEHMNDAWWCWTKTGITSVSRRQPRCSSAKASDLIGRHIWTEFPEGVGQPFQLAYEKAMKEQVSMVFEDHYEPWDLWFENRLYPSPDGLMILFTDISERKRFERLLEQRQHLLQKILDTEPGTVYIYDLEERRNVYINRHWLSAFGYTAEETQDMGEDLSALIFHPDDLPLIAEHHANWRQADEGEIRTIQYRVRAKTGEWHWLDSRETPFLRNASGEVRQILGIAHDVTDQMRMQEAALKEKDFSEAMLDSLPGVFYFYDRAGKFLRWNRNLEELTGYPPARSHKCTGLFRGEEESILRSASSGSLTTANPMRKRISSRKILKSFHSISQANASSWMVSSI
jgi:PAS domain S-box-containing protein